jgi:hypothetical protein
MSRLQLREAIERPIEEAGGSIENRCVQQILNEAGDSPDSLPLLQHVLCRMWELWRRDAQERPIDVPDYQRAGGFASALDQHANEVFDSLNERQQRVAECLFRRLCERTLAARDVRRPSSVREVAAVTGAEIFEVVAVADAFRAPQHSFLVPPGGSLTPDSILDITHESLIRGWDRLKEWADEEAQSAQLYRRLAETAALYHAAKAGLWWDPDLQVALAWREREKPTEASAELYGGGFQQAMNFLAESEAQRDREVPEKEEIQRRELAQAQALAEERQRRVEEQAAAARVLRRWLAFMLSAVVAALSAVIAAYYPKIRP